MIDNKLNNPDSNDDQSGLPSTTPQVAQEIQKPAQLGVVNGNISQANSQNPPDLESVMPDSGKPKSKLILILMIALLSVVVIGLVGGGWLWRYHYSDDALNCYR